MWYQLLYRCPSMGGEDEAELLYQLGQVLVVCSSCQRARSSLGFLPPLWELCLSHSHLQTLTAAETETQYTQISELCLHAPLKQGACLTSEVLV